MFAERRPFINCWLIRLAELTQLIKSKDKSFDARPNEPNQPIQLNQLSMKMEL
jgi:hypothetical protein